ncbi:PD-(D/E)XK nuclease family protein [Mesorhizobium sp.]|uniref:PD-(D/E)XK nuclease family protein n=1 Tax=Mesorhizobium sp. TaxID=1871066 RepID=UPI000FE4A379|nr:PD-(D/E)XK nuclease family protein [Mesorhizobium sp.]RWA84954.1 MAG: PD-(D/E)XK nuclease family protein [Mesorhizobium sp.]
MKKHELRTTVVQGPLAYAMKRAAAARSGAVGLQIVTPLQLAACLAGGLLRPATAESVERAVSSALAETDLLRDLDPVRRLPGMARAVTGTLRKTWRAGVDLAGSPWAAHPRVADLLRIEDHVRQALPPGELLLPDLCRQARAAVPHALRLVGPVRLEGVHTIDPLWRALINDLQEVVSVIWAHPAACDIPWFKGVSAPLQPSPLVTAREVTCADPAHEALEALRWARGLLASGAVRAADVAIAGASTAAWDEHMLALADSAGLRLCFVHGRPAMTTRDGQRCAALADVLLNGLSQARMRRLRALVAGQGTALEALADGAPPVHRDASLTTAVDWERALAAAPETQAALVPLLRLLERGVEGASDAAAALLRGGARRLWDQATRVAPPAALMLTLKTLRVPEENDPADSIVWCAADELAGAPRPYVWLVGLTSRGWPRAPGEDSILPGYIVPREALEAETVAAADARALANIRAGATAALTLSAGRLDGQGKKGGVSPLMRGTAPQALARDRPPDEPLTEGDRLFAGARDAPAGAWLALAHEAWRDWHGAGLTAHDGQVAGGHPLLLRAATAVQSPTSLTRMLRDPLGFVWRYALLWRDVPQKERPLTLPPDDWGQLVHELLRRAVDALEPAPGFTAAAEHEIDDALANAAQAVTESWPLERPVPPPVLWLSTVKRAASMARAGLVLESFTEPGTRSWTEVPFGGEVRGADARTDLPWDPASPVVIPGTTVAIRGSIDRLDLRAARDAVRVNDYKTGARYKDPLSVIIAGGAELQRVLYALACRQLLPETPKIKTRLIYLSDPALIAPLNDPDAAIGAVAGWVKIASENIGDGAMFPRVHTSDRNDMRFALPASPSYLRRKHDAVVAAAGALAACWRAK